MSRILTLDLSTNTGFCVDDVEAVEAPRECGMWPLPPYKTERGRMLARLRNGIMDLHEGLPLDRIYIEHRAPAFTFGGNTTSDTTDQQTYLEAAVFLAAYDLSLPPPEPISPRRARSRVFGRDMAQITQKEKTDGALVRRLQAMGLKVFDHNAADAITIWMWLRLKQQGKKRNG